MKKLFPKLVMALTAATVLLPAPPAAAGCVIDDIVEDLPRCLIYGSPPIYQACQKLGLC